MVVEMVAVTHRKIHSAREMVVGLGEVGVWGELGNDIQCDGSQ